MRKALFGFGSGNASWIEMSINPITKWEKMEEVNLGDCGTGGNHTTWRRFQDKWGRSITLNRIFKDKDKWFEEDPRDLREKFKFSHTQIWL